MNKKPNRPKTGPITKEYSKSVGAVILNEKQQVLIVDDEIDTGATVLGVARLLRQAGARGITAAAVHGVLSGPAIKNLTAVGYDKLFLTDSLPFVARQFPKVKVFSAAPVLAEAVARRSQWL